MDIAAWLRELGLERYEKAFREHAIDAAVLPTLTADDLNDLGVTIVGHRRKLLNAIAALRELPETNGTLTPAPRPQVAAKRTEAERRQLTVMFCDLVGSTALSARLDPEDTREVIRAYQNTVAGEIARFEGHVARFMGDGVLAYFGYPKAHEDEAERAVRAGMALVGMVAKLKAPAGEPLAARVGIATGLVVVGDLVGEGASQEQAVVGETPNLAARLQGLAKPSHVVIAPTTKQLVEGSFELLNLGEHDLKGLAASVVAFAVVGERVATSRFETRSGALLSMVGRGHELGLLLHRWAQAEAGEGQSVMLVGEAGIGKSRISHALLDVVAEQPHTCIRYQCSPYHSDSALWPVIRQLTDAAAINTEDPEDTKHDKLEALVPDESPPDAAALISDLIGLGHIDRYGALDLTPQLQRLRTLEILVDQLLYFAAQRPVILILEDAHWVDPTTKALIEQYLKRIADKRVLILLTSRPDNQPELAAHPNFSCLTLTPLGRSEAEAIVEQLASGRHLPTQVVDTIISRSDGIPLFVEELTKTVLESSAEDKLSIPASLHDSLMARLDRIPEVKEVAQVAACIGRSFDYSLVAAVANICEPELASALDKLAATELIFRRGLPPKATYTFKHSLVQDAAYTSLLRSRRLRLHSQIAQALEEQFPDTADAEPELLAHHFANAGEAERAVDYWSKASRRALGRSAYAEAMAHGDTGLKLLESLAAGKERYQRELDLQNSRAQASLAIRGWAAPETADAFVQARELCRRLENPPLTFPVLRGLAIVHYVRGQHSLALDIGHECLDLAERQDDGAALILAHRLIGPAMEMLGELLGGRQHIEQAIALYDPKLHREPALINAADSKIVALAHLSRLLWLLGYPDKARRAADKAIAEALQQESKYTVADTIYQTLFTRLFRRDYRVVLQSAEMVLGLADEHGIGAFVKPTESLSCSARLAISKRGEDIDPFGESIAAKRSIGVERTTAFQLGLLAEAMALNGRVDEALATIAEALEVTERTGECWSKAELYRLKGEIVLKQAAHGATVEAETLFHRSLDIARTQEARSWELRAATSLARLYQEEGKSRAASGLLTPVYNWFTEGFDTADLKEAKALLDELS